MIAHVRRNLTSWPIALVQSPGDDGLAFVLWQRNGISLTHDDQLLFPSNPRPQFSAHLALSMSTGRYAAALAVSGDKVQRNTGRVCSEPLNAGYNVEG